MLQNNSEDPNVIGKSFQPGSPGVPGPDAHYCPCPERVSYGRSKA